MYLDEFFPLTQKKLVIQEGKVNLVFLLYGKKPQNPHQILMLFIHYFLILNQKFTI